MTGEWRGMDSAPKDGTVVDLWCAGHPSDIDFYCPISTPAGGALRQGRVTNVRWEDDDWRPVHGLSRFHSLTVTPTHWRPLPPAPEGGE